jgi:hypothetical protein
VELREFIKGGKKDLFWLIVSEISVHGLLALLLLGPCFVIKSMTAQSMSLGEVTHLMVYRSAREEWLRTRDFLQRHALNDLFPLTRPYFLTIYLSMSSKMG